MDTDDGILHLVLMRFWIVCIVYYLPRTKPDPTYLISAYFPLTEISCFCYHQLTVGAYAFYNVRNGMDSVPESCVLFRHVCKIAKRGH
jgi:hypothetical protein